MRQREAKKNKDKQDIGTYASLHVARFPFLAQTGFFGVLWVYVGLSWHYVGLSWLHLGSSWLMWESCWVMLPHVGLMLAPRGSKMALC